MTPNYESTYVFENEFPALLENCPEPEESKDPLFKCSGKSDKFFNITEYKMLL